MLQYFPRPKLLDVLQHPIATTSASQTDGCDDIQTYIQTDDKILHEMATQTEDEEVPDSPKVNVIMINITEAEDILLK